MGIFGPSKQEKAASALATQPIVAQHNWRKRMKGTIPPLAATSAVAIQRSGRDPAGLDTKLIEERVTATLLAQLERYCTGLGAKELSWPNLEIVIGRSDFSMALLSDYLSSCGATGVAVHNKLVGFLDEQVPETFSSEIRDGTFDTGTR